MFVRAIIVYHVTSNDQVLRRSYAEFADRARGLAYYLREKGRRRVGVLATNTPAFLESIFGIVAAGGVLVPANYRYVQSSPVRSYLLLGAFSRDAG